MRGPVIAAFLALTAAMAAPAVGRDRDPVEHARAMRAAGDLEGAEALLEAALPDRSDTSSAPRVAIELARCRLEMWDAEGARDAVADGEDWSETLGLDRIEVLAIADFMSGREASARERFARLPGASPVTQHYLGLIDFNAGRFERALEHFSRALASDPEDYYSALHLGWCLLELGRLEEARAALGKLLERADSPEVWQLLGRVDLRAERFADASARFREALARSPDDAESVFGLATALRRLGDGDGAREAFDRFRVLHRRHQEALRRSYVLTQRQLSSGDVTLLEELAAHALSAGDPVEAERAAWRALRGDAARVGARLTLARALASAGRYTAAALHYRRLLRAVPDHEVATAELRALIRDHGRRVDDE